MDLVLKKLRWTSPATLCLGILLLALGLGLANQESAHADSPLAKARVVHLLKKELGKRALDVTDVRKCDAKRHGAVWVCDWTAAGTLAGVTPFDCQGTAQYNAKRRHWKGTTCPDPMVSLLPEAGPHPTFGYNEDWRAETQSPQPSALLQLLAASSAETTRQLMFWGQVEGLGPRHWDVYDRLYAEFLGQGIRPLWVLFGEPCWARPPGSNCYPWGVFGPPAPENLDDFANFAAEAAVRYPESLGFEVWNEPNNNDSWGGPPDPQLYGQMVGEVSAAIHAANPDMPVITAGLAPHRGGDDAAGMDYESFLRQAYATGGLQDADAIGAHPYPLRRYDQDYLGQTRANLFRYLRVMTEFGDQATPIWITEVGLSTEGEDEGYTYEQQADALVKMYALFRRVANVPVLIYHRLIDQPGHEQKKEEGYGVVAGNLEPKPAYCAIAAARGRPC